VKTTVSFVQNLIRLTWLVLLVLGIVLWTGHAPGLVLAHQLAGIGFVLLLWVLGYLGLRSDATRGLALANCIWGLVVLTLGAAQTQLLSGNLHWIVRVLHLLVGIAGIGLAEALAGRIRRRLASRE